jgi:hypothetical protein
VAGGICSTLSNEGGSCAPPGAAIDTSASYNDGCYAGLNCIGGACIKPPGSGLACSDAGTSCDLATTFCNSATGMCETYIAPGGSCNPSDSLPCGIAATCESPNDICEGSAPSCSPTL